MKQTILHINIHGNRSDVSSHHQEKPGCRCLPVWESTLICDSVLKAQRREGLDARAVDEMLLQVLEMDGGGGWERLLLCWQTENNHKITFLLSPSHTKRQVFFPSSAPSSFFFFFFFPQPHTIVNTDGCPEALDWIQWAGQGLLHQHQPPPVHFMLNIALGSTVWLSLE